jgi:tRNA(Ile)-lysidine synthase TilS/MesJ
VTQEAGLLVGFSGGRDSVALVALLQEGGFGGLTLLHLDHGLRAESGADAEWCRAFGRARGREVVVERTLYQAPGVDALAPVDAALVCGQTPAQLPKLHYFAS